MNKAPHVSLISFAICFFTLAGISTSLMSPALAQVSVLNASPAGDFDIVINLPGDETVITGASMESIGGVPGQTTQLNVSDGGSVGNIFEANSGSEVNISGGNVGFSFDAESGSVVNISGGNVGSVFDANSGSVVNISGGNVGLGFDTESDSVVNISGGTFGFSFGANSDVSISGGSFGSSFSARGSDVELIGGEFRLNGTDFTGATISITRGDVFAGTLADGSTFVFNDAGRGTLDDSVRDITLTSVPLPTIDLSPTVVNTAIDSGPSGLRSGQTLTLQTGGDLRDNFAVVGATLNVEDGIVGDSSEAYGGVLNISGGSVGQFFDATEGSQVNISGGTIGGDFGAFSSNVDISGGDVGSRFDAFDSQVNISGGNVGSSFDAFGSQVNVTGGTVGFGFNAESGSEVNISGGTVGFSFNAESGSVVNINGGTVGLGFTADRNSVVSISGGSVGQFFSARTGSNVELIGGEFRLNGADHSGSEISLGTNDVFTGTFADGSSFIFSGSDSLTNVALTTTTLPVADLVPTVVNTPIISGPSGLRPGQMLTLQTGGSLGDNLAVVDATLNVEAGVLGILAEATNSSINISGGNVGFGFNADAGSVVNISGGTVGNDFEASNGSEVNISGGTLDFGFDARSGSVVNIYGGSVGDSFEAFTGSQVNISGGTVGDSFEARGGMVNIDGGSVGDSFLARFGSEVNISGGSVGDSFAAIRGSVVNVSGGIVGARFDAVDGIVNISGGTVGSGFEAFSSSEVNIFGREFLIDGVELDSSLTSAELDALLLGQSVILDVRDVTLSGLLADGSHFSFDLNSDIESAISPEDDYFHPNATLSVTLAVPEPSYPVFVALVFAMGLARRYR